MNALARKLRRSKTSPASILGGVAVAGAVFISMGFTQLRIDYTPPEEPEPLNAYYLPPPPPPPTPQPTKKAKPVSISFGLPTSTEPGEIPLGFLDVDFGLKPHQLTQSEIDTIETVDTYQTDGLEELSVYDYQNVTEKPERRYKPQFNLPSRAIDHTSKPVTFIVLYNVSTDGRADNIHIIDCPYPEAIPYVKRYISSMRMKPATKNGKPVNCLVRYKFTYHPASSRSPFSL